MKDRNCGYCTCGDEWGSALLMNTYKLYLTDEEYTGMIGKIKADL